MGSMHNKLTANQDAILMSLGKMHFNEMLDSCATC